MSEDTSGSGDAVLSAGGWNAHHDPGTDGRRSEFDPEDGSDAAIVAIVETIGSAVGRPPTEITPLHASVDSGALGALATSRGNASVSFAHEGCHVTVASDGRVVVVPDDD